MASSQIFGHFRGLARMSAGNVTNSPSDLFLFTYTFFGLLALGPSWPRVLISLLSSVVALAWNTVPLAVDENVYGSWRWSPATTRSVSVFAVVVAGAGIPFLWDLPNKGDMSNIAIRFMAALIFATVVGLCVYVRHLLNTPLGLTHSEEYLKLEHQACLTLFQTLTTSVGVFFLAVFLSPALAVSEKAKVDPIGGLCWAFYCFAGAIIWLLRPCVAKAKWTRSLLISPAVHNPGTASLNNHTIVVDGSREVAPIAELHGTIQPEAKRTVTNETASEETGALGTRVVLLELLKQKQTEAATVVSYCIKGFTVFLAITGALFKFALDASATPELRNVLSWMGLSVCAIGFIACVCAVRLRRTVQSDLQDLFNALSVPLRRDAIMAVVYIVVVGVVFALVCVVGWVYLLGIPAHVLPLAK
jgi:hypothetical protein